MVEIRTIVSTFGISIPSRTKSVFVLENDVFFSKNGLYQLPLWSMNHKYPVQNVSLNYTDFHDKHPEPEKKIFMTSKTTYFVKIDFSDHLYRA